MGCPAHRRARSSSRSEFAALCARRRRTYSTTWACARSRRAATWRPRPATRAGAAAVYGLQKGASPADEAFARRSPLGPLDLASVMRAAEPNPRAAAAGAVTLWSLGLAECDEHDGVWPAAKGLPSAAHAVLAPWE